ncbi:hypothetical protein HG530_005175 [Fusarium avenaceum]|nr:hypothetical protein HG530_005175 [Fusarium avenaceum]
MFCTIYNGIYLLAESNLDGLGTSLGLLGVAVKHSEAGLAVSAFLEHGGDAIQTLASLFHGSSVSSSISESQLSSDLLHLTAEEPSLPVPATSNAASAGDIVAASHHHGVHLAGLYVLAVGALPHGRCGRLVHASSSTHWQTHPDAAGILKAGAGQTAEPELCGVGVVAQSLESKAKLNAFGQSDWTSVNDVRVKEREVEVTTRLEYTHALLETGVPLIFTILTKELEDAGKLSGRNEIKLVVGEGEVGELLNSNLAVVGGAADVAVGKLTHGLGGDGVNLGIRELERAVPRPVASSLSTKIKDPGALTGSATLAGSRARKTGKSLGHGSRHQTATVEHLHGSNVPSSHGHLVHGLNFLLMTQLLRVVDDGVITTSNVGAESLLGGLRDDAELVLAQKLVAVRFLE